MCFSFHARIRRRSATKKALLVGISYRNGTEGNGYEWGPIPTSIPNVKKFKKFIKGEFPPPAHNTRSSHGPFMLERWGYTNITVMTDKVGVKEKLRPTQANVVRPFPRPSPTFTYPDNSFL